MVTMVDPPGGWAYGFPAPLKPDYEQQLRDAGYPESDIPLAVAHSWYHDQPDDLIGVGPVYTAVDKAQPGGDMSAMVEYRVDGEKIVINRIYTGTASDGDDGA